MGFPAHYYRRGYTKLPVDKKSSISSSLSQNMSLTHLPQLQKATAACELSANTFIATASEEGLMKKGNIPFLCIH